MARTAKEAHLKDMRATLKQGLLAVLAGVAWLVAGSWWAVLGFVAGVCYLLLALAFRGLAAVAEPWDYADPPKRPRLQYVAFHGVVAALSALATVIHLVLGHWWYAAGWALWTASLWITFSEHRADRRATTQPKPAVRFGPPQEWL